MIRSIKNGIASIKNWWVFLIGGSMMIIGGILIAFFPEESYIITTRIFTTGLIISGMAYFLNTFRNRRKIKHWLLYLLASIIEISVGIYYTLNPDIPLTTLPFYLAFFMVFIGSKAILFVKKLRSYGLKKLSGLRILAILSIILGLVIITFPEFGMVHIAISGSISMILIGMMNSYIALRLKSIKLKTFDRWEYEKRRLLSIMRVNSRKSRK